MALSKFLAKPLFSVSIWSAEFVVGKCLTCHLNKLGLVTKFSIMNKPIRCIQLLGDKSHSPALKKLNVRSDDWNTMCSAARFKPDPHIEQTDLDRINLISALSILNGHPDAIVKNITYLQGNLLRVDDFFTKFLANAGSSIFQLIFSGIPHFLI